MIRAREQIQMNSSVARQNRESADAILAKNLVVARSISGMTQLELANRSLISRATIAQIESGSSDPRLSTFIELAAAFDVPPLFLLVGAEDVRILSALYGAAGCPDVVPVTASDLDKLKRLTQTGMLKDRLRAAQLAATIARNAGRESLVALIGAAIFSAYDPGPGTQVGTLLGRLASDQTRQGR